jgi:dUTP pyrophosphatase
MIKLKFKKLTDTAIIPTQAHKGDCFDLFSDEDITINSFESKIIHTNIAFDIPDGYRIKVFSRSSLPLKKKLIVSNAVGIIDTGYKNGVGLICHSLPQLEKIDMGYETKDKGCYVVCNGIQKSYETSAKSFKLTDKLIDNPVQIHKGDKIAQFQLEKIVDFELEEVEELDMSNDRKGGFGSTGSN